MEKFIIVYPNRWKMCVLWKIYHFNLDEQFIEIIPIGKENIRFNTNGLIGD